MGATFEARQGFSDIHAHASAIEHHQRLADQALQRARVAYDEKLYSEFWEVIKETMKALDTCQNSQTAIAINIDRYLTALENRVHDFPQWYAGLRPLQDLTPLVRELSTLKKKGDSNHEFVIIREIKTQRKLSKNSVKQSDISKGR